MTIGYSERFDDFDSYFDRELTYLRELGKEYALRHPNSAAHLGPSEARDPDVERLMEGFAFLVARLHQRLDSKYVEVAQAYLSILYPSLVRPIPAMGIVEFKPDKHSLRQTRIIPRGTRLRSLERKGAFCEYHTCMEVCVHPFEIVEVSTPGQSGSLFQMKGDLVNLVIPFELFDGVAVDQLSLDRVRIHLHHTDLRVATTLYYWLVALAKRVFIRSTDSDGEAEVEFSAVGFEANDGLLPESERENQGIRIVREYFLFPERFLFIDVMGLSGLKMIGVKRRFELRFDFGIQRDFPAHLRGVKADSMRLGCTPIVNLFSGECRISRDLTRSEYVVRAEGCKVDASEIYSVDRVRMYPRGSSAEVEYQPHLSRQGLRHTSPRQIPTFHTRLDEMRLVHDNARLAGTECYISFSDNERETRDSLAKGTVARLGSASATCHLNLTCTNRRWTTRLSSGDISVPTEDVPPDVTFRDIGRSVLAMDKLSVSKYYWNLISCLALSKDILSNADHLKDFLRVLNPLQEDSGSSSGVLTEMLTSLKVVPRLAVESGSPLRQLDIEIQVDAVGDLAEELYLFGTVLNRLFKHTSHINTRIAMTLLNIRSRKPALNWSRW